MQNLQREIENLQRDLQNLQRDLMHFGNLQRDFKENGLSGDSNGSAATDVSAFWLKSA